MDENKTLTLKICKPKNYNGSPAVYLNDYRIAGDKPLGGGVIIHEFNVEIDDINTAIKRWR